MNFNNETVKACVSGAVVIVVAVASACGIDIDGDMLTNVICAALLVLATGYGCWKNHNFTQAAQEGQKLIDEIKGKE